MPVTAMTVRIPITGYDDLRVTEIMPRLAGLSSADLGAILRHELEHKGRSTVIDRVEVLLREAAVASIPLPRRAADERDALDGDVTDYATHDPRLWRRLLVDVPLEPCAEEPSRRGLRWRRSA